MRVEEYILEDGTSPFKSWFEALAPDAAAKVVTAINRLERGLVSAISWFGGIGEYKIDWGPGIRIYLAQDGKELIILLGGGTKKLQSQDIENAKFFHQQYKDRKNTMRAAKPKSTSKSSKKKR